jgi:hypothetical protein
MLNLLHSGVRKKILNILQDNSYSEDCRVWEKSWYRKWQN